MDVLDQYLGELKKLVDGVFRAPLPNRQMAVETLFRFMGDQQIRPYDVERIAAYFAGPSGVVRGTAPPSPLVMYQALDVERKEEFAEYFNREFQATEQTYPECWHAFQDRLEPREGN
jgi:hypothetical protein